jgi:hypothetical protein
LSPAGGAQVLPTSRSNRAQLSAEGGFGERETVHSRSAAVPCGATRDFCENLAESFKRMTLVEIKERDELIVHAALRKCARNERLSVASVWL